MTNSIRARLRRAPINASDYQCSRLQVTAPGCVIDHGTENRCYTPTGASIGREHHESAVDRWSYLSGYRIAAQDMACNLAISTAHIAADVASRVCEANSVPEWVSHKLSRAQTDLTDVHHFLKGKNT